MNCVLVNDQFSGIPWLLAVSLFLISCAGTRPTNLGIDNSELSACPATPNCVSSDDREAARRILPFRLKRPLVESWQVIRAQALKIPRTTVIRESEDYLQLECRSAVFGFVDDLEFHLRPEEGIVALRSAARMGYSDFGVNRERIEALRSTLIKSGVIE